MKYLAMLDIWNRFESLTFEKWVPQLCSLTFIDLFGFENLFVVLVYQENQGSGYNIKKENVFTKWA